MTVFLDKKRKRWRYDFVLRGDRHFGYCLAADGQPVTTRSAAMQAEGVARRMAETAPKIAAADATTLALVMNSLTPIWQRQAHWSNKQRYMRELLTFFGAATPIADIDDMRVQDYITYCRTEAVRSWRGGPTRDPSDARFASYWIKGDQPRSPATINLYLGTLRQVFARAALIRDPITRQPAIERVPVVPELAVPKRKARPIPDAVLTDILGALPQHAQEAVIATLYFGFRRNEIFTLQIHNVDFDANGVRLFAEGVKDNEDTFMPGAPEAMVLLRHLVDQAVARGTRHLITYRRPRKNPDAQKLVPWLPIKRPKSAWKRVMTMVEGKFGRRFRWHDIRAAFITHVALTSGQLAAQTLGRHAEYSTTQGYVEMADEMRRLAADRVASRPALVRLKTR